MGIRLSAMTCGWLTGELGHLMEGGEGRIRLPIPGLSRAVPMVRRLRAGAGFEPSVPRSTERTNAAASDLQEETG
jgi:hypothetical protein